MAKILFTGASGKQHNDKADARAKINRINDSTIIINSLKKSGHTVERKKVTWTDDLSEYDIGIVGIGSLGSPNYANMMNALYAISALDKVIIFHEDWKIQGTMKGLKSSIDKLEKMLKKQWANGNYLYDDADKADINVLQKVMQDIIDGKYPVLIPGYDWGNKQIIADILNIKKEHVNNIDLSPYVLQSIYKDPCYSGRTQIPEDRELKYMLAALTDNRPWVKKLKLTYEVDYFGCKAIETAEILEDELAVFETMNNYWGVLCPAYPQAGSGWFRMRFMYSALNKNIMVMDKQDCDALNIPHITKIEDYSLEDLQEIAEQQSQAILKYSTSIDQFDAKINSIVEKYL